MFCKERLKEKGQMRLQKDNQQVFWVDEEKKKKLAAKENYFCVFPVYRKRNNRLTVKIRSCGT